MARTFELFVLLLIIVYPGVSNAAFRVNFYRGHCPAEINLSHNHGFCIDTNKVYNPVQKDSGPFYNIDGKSAYDLLGLTPAEIAYIQILSKTQSFVVFGTNDEKGLIYVTTKAKRNSDSNVTIQRKIDELHPMVGSYLKNMAPNELTLVRAEKLAEDGHWLILIDNAESTIEHLKSLSPNEVRNISYQEGDQTEKYGPKAINGMVSVTTGKLPH